MSDQLPSIYTIELFYKSLPKVDGKSLLRELERRCGRVKIISGEKGSFPSYVFPDYAAYDGQAPVTILLVGSEKRKEGQPELGQALQQSWGWRGAEEAIAGCRASLILSDLMAQGLEPKRRLDLIHKAIESVLVLAPCKAIHWMPCQHLVNPSEYLAARKSGAHPLRFAVNVRLFNIAGTTGDMLMDTMGLGILGLPDLQCHFHNQGPSEVAGILNGYAYYLFDHGDVIQDGETIDGIRPEDSWKCRHETALMKPERVVLDIDPGPAYAAGTRE